MRILLTILITSVFAKCYGQVIDKTHIKKATVAKSDSVIWLTANIRLDHRIFGYSKPDTNSQKMILFSVFTNDVEANPYQCPLGAYYQTNDMHNRSIKFVSKQGHFIKASVLDNDSIISTVYFLRQWIKFEK